ncbi:hypothetical protein ACFQU7_02295 [Pseudoroseomonas wenyumeiae]
MAEAGLQGVDVENWYGVIAPAGVPPERIAKLEQAIMAAARSRRPGGAWRNSACAS